MAKIPDDACSIARTLGVVGERWTLLILREAFLGATRFAEFRDRLGVAPDILSDRLATLVEHGVMAREPYREPGARSRSAYRLTPAGRELQVVLSALQQWGDEHLPRPEGPSMLRRVRGTGCPVHVGYLDDEGREIPLADVAVIPAGQGLSAAPKPAAHEAATLEPEMLTCQKFTSAGDKRELAWRIWPAWRIRYPRRYQMLPITRILHANRRRSLRHCCRI